MALYHQTSNGPVEVKKHQIKGAVGYTVVGTPTIKDGIVSGFSSSDYIEVPFNKNWKVISEFVVSIKDKQTTGNMRFVACTSNTTLSFGCNETSVWVSIGSQAIGAIDNDLMPNGHDYIIKYTRVGSVCSLYITQDNGSEQFVGSITEDGEDDNSSEIRFLYNDNLGDTKVDFNHTYIKLNGDLWFYQPQETKYIIYENPTTHAQYLVFANRDLFLSGAVILEEEGSPLVKDGIFTYTSGSDYLQAEETLTWDESSDLEVYSRFKTPSTFHESNMPIISNEPYTTPFMWIWGNSIYFQLPSTNIDVYPPNSGSLSTDTWYRIKVTGKNNSWTMTLYSDDGTVINQITYTPSTGTALTKQIAISRQYNGYPPVECVDLKETYIKKNGKLWLYGKNFSDTNIAVVPEGFTYGTTTTTSNGYVDMRTQGFLAAPEGARFCGEEPEPPQPTLLTISGFTGTKYWEPYEVFTVPSTVTSADIIIRGTLTSTGTRHNTIIGFEYQVGNNCSYLVRLTNAIPSCYFNGWKPEAQTAQAVTANESYWYRIIQDNGSTTLYSLKDNDYTIDTLPSVSTWTLQFTATSGAVPFRNFRLGSNPYNDLEYWTGTMDQFKATFNGNVIFDLYAPGAKAILESHGLTVTES